MSKAVKNKIPVGQHSNAHIELYTIKGDGTPGKMFVPVLLDEIRITSAYECSPSKMKFTVLKDGIINFGLGTKAVLKIDDSIVWVGYVMYKHRTSDVKIECTAYDQMRYLKNQIVKSYTEQFKVEDAIKDILNDLELPVGDFDELEECLEEPQVFDQVEALEVIEDLCDSYLTKQLKNLVFFDDKGELSLKLLDNMRVTNQFFTADELEDWDYTTSIEDSYNSIIVEMLEDDGETHDRYIKVEDEESINRWGLLRYMDKDNQGAELAESKAKALLKLTNRETRTLKLTGVLGNTQVRGGSLVAVKLNLGDMLLYSWMVVKEVTHTIGQSGYTMDMELQNTKLGFDDPVSPEGNFSVTKATTTTTDETGSTSTVGGSGTNEERTWNFLRANGFSAAATAGVMGNIAQESGFVLTSVEEGSGVGYGLFQWSYSRRTALQSWCSSNGKDYTSLDGQLNYFLYEFNSESGWLSYAQANCAGTSGYKNLIDVTTATTVFMRGFERCNESVSHLDKRISSAKSYYNKWSSYTTIPGTGSTSSGSGGTSSGSCPDKLWKAVQSTDWPGKGLCATWTSRVFAQLGISINGNGCDQTSNYCHSANRSALKPGMLIGCVHSPWSYQFGHIAIYVGNDTVYSSETSGIAKYSVDTFINMYGPNNGGSTVMWGWAGGVALS